MAPPDLVTVFKRQLDGCLAMLAQAIEQCPDRAWTDDRRHAPAWEQLYHVLYWFNAWLRDWSVPLEEPEFHVKEALEIKRRVSGSISRAQMKAYLAKVRAEYEAFIAGVTPFRLLDEQEAWGTRWTVADRILGQVRHLQHHVGYLNALLAGDGLPPVRWVGYGEG